MTEESASGVTDELEALIEERDHLKKKLGDQGNELGQLRQTVDSMLQQQTTQTVEEDDWFADPTEKKVNALESQVMGMKQEQALRELEGKHPGFRDLPNNESFASWVGASPYRSKLYAKADSMDFTAADELFTAWEEQQEAANQSHQQANADRQAALNNASMEKGSAGGARKQYFSRKEIIHWMQHEPQKYEANRDEIMQAYAEGRVKR